MRGFERNGKWTMTGVVRFLVVFIVGITVLLFGYVLGYTEGTEVGKLAEQTRTRERTAEQAIEILKTSNCFDREYWESVLGSEKNPNEEK